MKKSTILVTLSAIVVLFLGAGTGTLYYLNQQVKSAKQDLRTEIKSLNQENAELKADLKELEEQAKEAEEKIEETKEKSGKESPTPAREETETEAKDEEDSITQVIEKAIDSMALDPGDFDVINIKHKNNWATAQAAPEDSSMETELFVLQKKNGTWTIIGQGTGLGHSDYPDSPPELWP